MQQQLMAHLAEISQLGEGLHEIAPWGARGVCFYGPKPSDDLTYATVGHDGIVRVWWGRLHVDNHRHYCNAHNVAQPPEELICTTAHHAYGSADEFISYVALSLHYAVYPQ